MAFFLSPGGIDGVILKKTETKIEVLQVFLKQLHIAIVYWTRKQRLQRVFVELEQRYKSEWRDSR